MRKIWVPTPTTDLGSSRSEGVIYYAETDTGAVTCYWELRTFNLVVRNIGSLSSPAGAILIVSTDPVIWAPVGQLVFIQRGAAQPVELPG